MKRTPLRHHRPEPVPYSERAAVYARDKVCFLYRLDSEHICRDPWGSPHGPRDLSKMTVDHVAPFPGGMRGKRPEHLRQFMVTMCWAGNVGAPSKDVRQAERAYLALLPSPSEV
jgi:hypothetical protein